jgi:uncharacterized UBP type Zn finger protein
MTRADNATSQSARRPSRRLAPAALEPESFAGLLHANIGLRGLPNLGNTCYLNASIQALAPIVAGAPDCVDIKSLSPLVPVATLLWGTKDGDIKKALEEVLERLRRRRAPATNKRMFRKGKQHDAHECIVALIADVNSAAAKQTLPPIFAITEQSALSCNGCGIAPSVTCEEAGGCITLEAKGCTTLEECLKQWHRKEVLDQENLWKACNREEPQQGNQHKRLSIGGERPPRMLILALKRFEPVPGSKTTHRKLTRAIEYPLTGLDLTEQLATMPSSSSPSRPILYDLAAVVMHHGETAANGHCTTVAKHAHTGKWHCYDDTRVTPLPNGPTREQDYKSGYVLFYKLRAKHVVA